MPCQILCHDFLHSSVPFVAHFLRGLGHWKDRLQHLSARQREVCIYSNSWYTFFRYHKTRWRIGPVHSASLSLRALDGDISKSHVAWNLAADMRGSKNLQMPHQERATLISLLSFVECTAAITANAKLSCASARVAKKGARPPSLSLSLSSGSPNSKRTFSPRYTPMHATCDFIGSRTYYNDDRKSWNESSKIGVMNQRYF